MDDHFSVLLTLASPSFSWAWHSSAPACSLLFSLIWLYQCHCCCLWSGLPMLHKVVLSVRRIDWVLPVIKNHFFLHISYISFLINKCWIHKETLGMNHKCFNTFPEFWGICVNYQVVSHYVESENLIFCICAENKLQLSLLPYFPL